MCHLLLNNDGVPIDPRGSKAKFNALQNMFLYIHKCCVIHNSDISSLYSNHKHAYAFTNSVSHYDTSNRTHYETKEKQTNPTKASLSPRRINCEAFNWNNNPSILKKLNIW